MITVLNLSVEQSGSGLVVCEVDNAVYISLCAQVGMIRRSWQLPQHDVRYVAHVDLERRVVRQAIADYLNNLLGLGKVG